MELTHYIAVQATGSDACSPNALLSQVLMTAHIAAARRFGCAFPDASAGQQKPTSAPERGYRSHADETDAYRLAHLSSKPRLGNTVQFFGSHEAVSRIAVALNAMPRGMLEFIDIFPVQPIPAHVGFVQYKRVRNAIRTEATIQRELRRTLRRHPGDVSIAAEAALAERRRTIVESAKLPYVAINSKSNRQSFCIHFDVIERQEASLGDGFDGYGFALNGATVPFIPA